MRQQGAPAAVVAAAESSGPVAAAPVQQPESNVAPSTSAQSVPVKSAPAHAATGSPRVKETTAAPHTTAQNLSGKWNIVNTVQTTSYRSFKNLQLGFALSIDQNGNSFTGRGLKVSENGRILPVNSRTPIEVKGSIKGDRVEAVFYEEGTVRKTNGKFVWRLDNAGRGLTGSFNTTAARSSGKSAATKAL
jgi:hypothetical protein